MPDAMIISEPEFFTELIQAISPKVVLLTLSYLVLFSIAFFDIRKLLRNRSRWEYRDILESTMGGIAIASCALLLVTVLGCEDRPEVDTPKDLFLIATFIVFLPLCYSVHSEAKEIR